MSKKNILGLIFSSFLVFCGSSLVSDDISEFGSNYNKISYVNHIVNFDNDFTSESTPDRTKEMFLNNVYNYIEYSNLITDNEKLDADLLLLIEKENSDLLITKYILDKSNGESTESILENLNSYNNLSREDIAIDIYNNYDVISIEEFHNLLVKLSYF